MALSLNVVRHVAQGTTDATRQAAPHTTDLARLDGARVAVRGMIDTTSTIDATIRRGADWLPPAPSTDALRRLQSQAYDAAQLLDDVDDPSASLARSQIIAGVEAIDAGSKPARTMQAFADAMRRADTELSTSIDRIDSHMARDLDDLDNLVATPLDRLGKRDRSAIAKLVERTGIDVPGVRLADGDAASDIDIARIHARRTQHSPESTLLALSRHADSLDASGRDTDALYRFAAALEAHPGNLPPIISDGRDLAARIVHEADNGNGVRRFADKPTKYELTSLIGDLPTIGMIGVPDDAVIATRLDALLAAPLKSLTRDEQRELRVILRATGIAPDLTDRSSLGELERTIDTIALARSVSSYGDVADFITARSKAIRKGNEDALLDLATTLRLPDGLRPWTRGNPEDLSRYIHKEVRAGNAYGSFADQRVTDAVDDVLRAHDGTRLTRPTPPPGPPPFVPANKREQAIVDALAKIPKQRDGSRPDHIIKRSEVRQFLAGSAVPRWVNHGADTEDTFRSVLENGGVVTRNKASRFGQGFYNSEHAAGNWGHFTHRVAVRAEKPLKVDNHAELVAYYKSRVSPNGFDAVRLRQQLLQDGYDSIYYTNANSNDGFWLIGLESHKIKVVLPDELVDHHYWVPPKRAKRGNAPRPGGDGGTTQPGTAGTAGTADGADGARRLGRAKRLLPGRK